MSFLHKYLFSLKIVGFSLLLITCCFYSFAQTTNGKITGKVIDGAINETLIGVSVKASETTYGTSTNADGVYVLTVPAGTYTVVYKYIGYQPKEISGIVVKAGQSTFQNIILQSASQQMQEVVVKGTAKKEGQSSVYSAQKRSSAASDGISQEAIRRTPDNNAAQVLTRVTGINIQDNKFVVVRGLSDQYNQTMVNGVQMTSTQTDRNAFAFDLIPAAVVDNIVVNKTATPDMPGNFAGGVVQVNTKEFPDNNFFSVSVQSGYSTGTLAKDFYGDKRGGLQWMGFGGSHRNLPKDFPTANSRNNIFALNAQEKYRHMKTLPNNLIPINYGPSVPNTQTQLGYGRSFDLKDNKKFGVIIALNQRKTELTEQETAARQPLFAGGNDTTKRVLGLNNYSQNIRYNYSSNFGAVLNLAYRFGNNKITLKNLYTSSLRNTYIMRHYVLVPFIAVMGSESSIAVGMGQYTEQADFKTSVLAGEHRTGENNATRIDWNINATNNKTKIPDAKNFLFRRDTVSGLFKTNDNPNTLSESLGTFGRFWLGNTDVTYGGAFNITSTIDINKTKNLFKGGILFQNRRRNTSGTILPVATNGYTTLDSVLSPDRQNSYQTLNYLSLSRLAQSGATYLAASSLLAVYESFENKIGKNWRIIWGARLENYQQNLNPGKLVFDENFKEPEIESIITGKTSSRVSLNLLPSVNLIYSPTEKINFRGAFSKTVIRPDLKDLLEQDRFDFQTLTNTIGNRFIKSTNVTNYDLKFEWFPSAGEILSFGAFYKKMKNPIEYAEATQERLSIRKAINTGDAYVRGVEAEFRKKLNFIPFAPWLSHVTLFGNGTYLKSKVSYIDLLDEEFDFFNEHTLSGQPNYIINTGINLSLFNNTFDCSLSFNKTGDYINSLGSADLDFTAANGVKSPLNPHFRLKSRDMLDLVASQSILKKKGQLRFKISNLLNNPFIIYQDLNANGKFDSPVTINPDKSLEKETNYLSGIDNTATYIKPQLTYSFSFAYTF